MKIFDNFSLQFLPHDLLLRYNFHQFSQEHPHFPLWLQNNFQANYLHKNFDLMMVELNFFFNLFNMFFKNWLCIVHPQIYSSLDAWACQFGFYLKIIPWIIIFIYTYYKNLFMLNFVNYTIYNFEILGCLLH